MDFENTCTYGNFAFGPEQYDVSNRAFKKADVIMKLNNTETMFNKRVLCLESNVLYYYSKVPSDFTSGSFEKLKGSPKAGVRVENILNVIFKDEPTKNEKDQSFIFTIIFHSSRHIEFLEEKDKKLRKTENILGFVRKKKEEHGEGKLIKWKFSCHIDQKQTNYASRESINQWLDILAKNREVVYTPNKELKALEINYLVELEQNKKKENL